MRRRGRGKRTAVAVCAPETVLPVLPSKVVEKQEEEYEDEGTLHFDRRTMYAPTFHLLAL